MAKFKSIMKVTAGAITAVVGGLVALKGAKATKASKEDNYDATLEEINESPEPETEDKPEEEIPEVEVEEVETEEDG